MYVNWIGVCNSSRDLSKNPPAPAPHRPECRDAIFNEWKSLSINESTVKNKNNHEMKKLSWGNGWKPREKKIILRKGDRVRVIVCMFDAVAVIAWWWCWLLLFVVDFWLNFDFDDLPTKLSKKKNDFNSIDSRWRAEQSDSSPIGRHTVSTAATSMPSALSLCRITRQWHR